MKCGDCIAGSQTSRKASRFCVILQWFVGAEWDCQVDDQRRTRLLAEYGTAPAQLEALEALARVVAGWREAGGCDLGCNGYGERHNKWGEKQSRVCACASIHAALDALLATGWTAEE